MVKAMEAEKQAYATKRQRNRLKLLIYIQGGPEKNAPLFNRKQKNREHFFWITLYVVKQPFEDI